MTRVPGADGGGFSRFRSQFLPRSLLWRTFFLVALLILLSVLAWFEIYSFYEQGPRAKAAAQLVGSVVNLTRTALVNAEPSKRLALLMDVSVLEGIRLYPAEDSDKVDPLPNSGMLGLLGPELKSLLGEDTRVALAVNRRSGLWVSFFIDDDEYWVVMQRDRFDRVIPGEWLGWGGATVLLSLFGAYLIVFGVTRPLKGLSAAARAIGKGETPAPLAEVGASEIATVAHAFNQMSRDLSQLEADRTLILAGVSHDLRTPLARLRLGIEMVAGDDPMRDGMVEDIEDMDRIIGQFLDFARETGGEALGDTDVAALMADVADSYTRRGLAVSLDTYEGTAIPVLPARSQALRRALSNLVENALRYAGTPITLRLGAEHNALVIDVLDEGPGIPPDQVERVKRPFARLESARSNAAGAGLGLAIVDRVARIHGGELKLLPRREVDGIPGLVARLVLPLPAPRHHEFRVKETPHEH